jgi:hypothetical protein
MNRDDDPKLFLDEHEWRCYKRATRNLRHKQRMERVNSRGSDTTSMAWLQAVEWDDAGDPVLDISENETFLSVELVA